MNNPIAERNGWGKTDGETCGTCRFRLCLGGYICDLTVCGPVKHDSAACGNWELSDDTKLAREMMARKAARKEGEGK